MQDSAWECNPVANERSDPRTEHTGEEPKFELLKEVNKEANHGEDGIQDYGVDQRCNQGGCCVFHKKIIERLEKIYELRMLMSFFAFSK